MGSQQGRTSDKGTDDLQPMLEPLARGIPDLPHVQHPSKPCRVGSNLSKRPLHTNKFYTTLFLPGSGSSQPLYVHPYVLKVTGKNADGSGSTEIQVSYSSSRRVVAPPKPDGRSEFYYHNFEVDLALSMFEDPSSTWFVKDADNVGLGVTLDCGSWEVPIVRGMAYVTAIFRNEGVGSPYLRSSQKILRINGNAFSSQEIRSNRLRLELSNGQRWLVFLLPENGRTANWIWKTDGLRCSEPFAGVVQLAFEPTPEAASILESHSGIWCSGAELCLQENSYSLLWKKHGHSPVKMLHCAQPHHLESIDLTSASVHRQVQFSSTTKGLMTAVAADEWILKVKPLDVGWLPRHQADPSLTNLLRQELEQDLAEDIQRTAGTKCSNYFAGKALFRYAQSILVADALGAHQLRDLSANKLIEAIATFAAGKTPNSLVYDETWRGVVGKDGLSGDKLFDFGNSFYNDHHYHWGYFLGAAAVARRFGTPNTLVDQWVEMLIRDVANPSLEDTLFPTWRNFDWFSGHSWSQGLFESVDGKDQESISEEGMFHYGCLLWGLASGRTDLVSRSRLVLGVMVQAAQKYFFMQSVNSIHPVEFVRNRVTGIFFENKAHHTTWFSPRTECIHGIQMMPTTPLTEYLRPKSFIEQEWRDIIEAVLPKVADGWRSVLLMNLAAVDPDKAFRELKSCNLDDGLNRSWALFWAATCTGCGIRAEIQPAVMSTSATENYSGPLFQCSLSLVGRPGSQNIQMVVRPTNPEGVSLVAVHYSINGGEQWNVDIRQPAVDGAWIHDGSLMPGAPQAAPGNVVSYWLYCIRNGLGEEQRNLEWIVS